MCILIYVISFQLPGPEKKSRIPDEEANLVTAYHEGGHALVAHYTKDSHPLHKVTIIPRGPSLGHVRKFFLFFFHVLYDIIPQHSLLYIS